MSNIILGCDLDDCILETGKLIFEDILKDFPDKARVAWENQHTFHLEHVFDLPESVVDKYVYAVLESERTEPISGAIECLNWLTQFVPLYVITFRKDYLRGHTMYLLDSAGLEDYELVMTHKRIGGSMSAPSKAGIIDKLGVTVMIEDRPDTIKNLYNTTDVDIIVFDRPWNRHVAQNERITICQTWHEIRNILKERIYNG